MPIPAPLDWSDDPSNPIGSAYIILEHTGKVALQKVWDELLSDKKVKTIDAIYTDIAPTCKLNFSAYGSLYFTDTAFLDVDSKQKLENDSTFCVRPHCKRTFWDCNVEELRYYTYKEPNRRPCKMAFIPLASVILKINWLPRA